MTKTRNLADLGGGFIQEGTGAVQRTVESKLQDVVSVKDFGAVGDGVADDTAAIQAALNSNARTIHLIGGQTYKVTSSITIPANKIVVGNGATITTASHFTVFTFSNGGGIYNTKFIGPGKR
jgi:polygalacturonase